MILLYNENDVPIRDIRIYEINDADMGESTITATVKFDQVMQFHPDWYVLLNGEKYKLGVTEPSGKRSTTKINVEYTLTFHSSREDLKRYTFMDFVEYGSGNPQPSQHTFNLQTCTLGQLVNRFNINLQYYLGSLWTMELSEDADPSVVADLSFDKASLWDVLLELYKDYGVRWTIRSNDGYMTILVGENATELQTIFEYGIWNGLISVERTNPTERIVTRLRGKGSEKNLPANYFHAATSAFPIADPDTNSILQGIFYNRLYPKCYRDYVRGYNSGEKDVEETWAYHQGAADKIAGKPMNIVDFAKSDKEALWGISYGAVEDNDEIYPTLQGATRNGVELDKVLAVSPIYVDAPDDGAAERQFTQVNGEKGSFQGRDMHIRVNGRDGGISSVVGISNAKSATADSETFTLETAINTVRAKFLVTPTKFADHYANAVGVTDPESPTLTTVVEMAANNWNFVERIQLINATTGAVVKTWSGNNQDFFDVVADDIPAGTYKFRSYIQWYKTTGATVDKLLYTIDWQLYGCEYASYQNALSKKTFSETFDIWIGNVWNTSKQESESDEAYACRVWTPLVSKEEMTVMFSDGLLAGEDYEFPIVGLVNDSDNLAEIIKKAIHYDTSVSGSHWRLTLQKSDAEFEASGKYLPNSVINVLPGNHFFFINIQMPYDPYIYDAERRQQEYLEDQLSLLDIEQPTFAVVPSSVFMASLDEVDNVVPGNKIRLRDASLIGSSYTTAYIQSITKRYTENKINPDWSLVVSDQILVNGNPITLIEGKVDALSKQMYSSKQAIKDAIEAFAQFYLRKDGLPDASFSATDFRAPVTFRDKITDYNFRQGDFGGYGFGVYTDPDGNRVVEADVLVGRTALRINELITNQVEYVGGQKIYSAAAMTVSKVENTATIWRCYFDNKQGTVRNMFLVGDLAFCQRFNGTEEGGYTTYWAKVTAIGSDYIELSKTDLMSAGSGSPAVGDNIIQLGNVSDQDRQSAIILSSYGTNSPSIRLYNGITDYTLANKDIFGVEYDSTNQIPYFYNYGSMRLGAKKGEDGGYITYDHKSKELKINAIVNFLPQSTGLEQMESYQKLVKIAQGNIETWFYDGVSPIQSGAPTMSNYPVNTWEAADYENHIGDIYYSNTGKGYRFKRSGSTWEWEIISDAEMAQLMAEVQNLQYLKTALSDGTTTVAGGLILTSLIQLGYKDAQDVRHTMAGISGLGQNSTAPAAWFGGPMVDHELNPDATEYAKSLFRFNGTGYLANGNITWDEKGYGQVGGEGDNYALKWNDKEVRIGPNIKLGAGDETIAMLANLLNMFELDTTSVAGKTLIHAKYDGLYSDGDIAAGGAFAGTPSGGGKNYLNELLDVQLATSSLNVGDMLMWNGVKYVNIPQSSITPDLSAYATQQWVLDKKYLTSVPVTSVVGQTGNITAAQVATALTNAGYKLTDTTYELATTTSNGLMSATDKTKLDGIAANANNYTLPTASSSTKGGIKVGTTLSIYNAVLDLKSGFPKGTYTKVQIDDYGRVSSGSTLFASDIPSLPWSKITTGKPTTISGYGITDAYTKTETDNKVEALQSLLDSMFVRVYDSNNKLIRIHSNVTISSSGDLVAGGNSEGGTPSGGAFTQLEWNAIKTLTQSESGLLASAYAVKEAYNELNTAIETLAGKATNVTFTQTIKSGKQIGSISIDGKRTSLYAPASYAWSEITGKPSFAAVATSGSYIDLANKPTMLPANGGNADTVDGLHASSFAQWKDCDNVDTAYDFGFWRMLATGSGSPTGKNNSQFITVPYRKTTGNTTPDFAWQILAPNGDDPTHPEDFYVRTGLSKTWKPWRKLYHSGNSNNTDTVWSAKRLATTYNLICPYTWNQKGSLTGTLVLSLPYGFNSMMQCIELSVYDYSSINGHKGATKFFINGYNFYSSNSKWINPYAFSIGNKNVKVRLGYYNNKCCILIGETNTTWEHPGLSVDNIYGYYANHVGTYKDDDWSCVVLQDESQITHIETASDTPLYAPCYTRAGLPYVTDNDVAAKYLKLAGGTISGWLIINASTLPISELTTDGITSNNTWNSAQNVNLLLRSANNAMTISLGGQENERKGIIQVGHSASSYANFLGDLYLNKFGGNVYIGENIAYHAGNFIDGVNYISPRTTLAGYGITDASRIFRYTIPASGNKGVRITFTSYEPVKITVSGANRGAQLVLVGTGYGDGGFVRNNFTEVVPSNVAYSWCVSNDSACSVEIFSKRADRDFVIVESPSHITFTAISALSTTAASRHLLTSANYSSYALPLTGGTITGSIRMNGISEEPPLIYNYTRSAGTPSGWARNIVKCSVDDKNDFHVSVFGSYTPKAENNKIQYAYLGFAEYNGLNLRISETSLSWGTNVIYHSGNCNLSTIPWTCSSLTANGHVIAKNVLFGQSLEFSNISSSANHGGYIDFHYNGSTADYTSRIIEDDSHQLTLLAQNVVVGTEHACCLYLQRPSSNYIWANKTGGALCLGTADGGETSALNSGINIIGKKVYIGGTQTGSDALNVAGDVKATGWCKATSGFLIEESGVYYTHHSQFGEIDIVKGNEFIWGSKTDTLYFNYRASANETTTVAHYIWNAGSPTTYATHTMGSLTVLGAITATTTIHATTGIYTDGYISAKQASTSSDRRLKTDFRSIDNALKYVLNTHYTRFRWKDDNKESIGIIAQEEQNREYGFLVQNRKEIGHLTYDYAASTALLGAAIQEEDSKVEKLRKRIIKLENELSNLKKKWQH